MSEKSKMWVESGWTGIFLGMSIAVAVLYIRDGDPLDLLLIVPNAFMASVSYRQAYNHFRNYKMEQQNEETGN